MVYVAIPEELSRQSRVSVENESEFSRIWSNGLCDAGRRMVGWKRSQIVSGRSQIAEDGRHLAPMASAVMMAMDGRALTVLKCDGRNAVHNFVFSLIVHFSTTICSLNLTESAWSSEASKRGMLPSNGLSVKNCQEELRKKFEREGF